jgi:4'-phosphopantetheinyl transferase
MVCLINLEEEAGVDVEFTGRLGKTVELADRFFTKAEVRDLRALPEAEQRDQFFRYWTLKEAYMKARGLGMALPLDQFGFHVVGEEPRGISFGAGIQDHSEDWHFSLQRLGSSFRAAAGVRRRDSRTVRFRWRELAPGLLPG